MTFEEKLTLIAAEGKPEVPADVMPIHRSKFRKDSWRTQFTDCRVSDTEDDYEINPGWFW